MRSSSKGLTLVEFLAGAALSVAVGTLAFFQLNDLRVTDRDNVRKTAVNAVYYNLREVYYPANQFYPIAITATTLTGIDPAILKDPDGVALGEPMSTYRYEGIGCVDGKCKDFEIRALLEKEADFVKRSTTN